MGCPAVSPVPRPAPALIFACRLIAPSLMGRVSHDVATDVSSRTTP